MSISKEDLHRLALELTKVEHAALAGMLLESIEPGDDPDVESAWLAEVERRVAEWESGAATPDSWALVRDRLRRKLTG